MPIRVKASPSAPIQMVLKKTIENISGESRWNSESEMKEMRFMGSSAVTPAGLFALGGNGPGSFLSVPMTHHYCRTSLSENDES